VYTVTDGTSSVSKPTEILALKRELRFEFRYVGFNRYYTAMQASVEISKIIRIQRQPDIATQDVVILADTQQYRIQQMQDVINAEPACSDLTLVLVASPFEIGGVVDA